MKKFYHSREKQLLMAIGNHFYLKELPNSDSKFTASNSAVNIINMIGIHDIVIDDLSGEVKITLESPGILIGLKGSDLNDITYEINKIINGRKPYKIELIECELNRYLLGFQIAIQYSEDPDKL